MFTQIHEAPENVIAILVTGKITTEDYRKLDPIMEAHKEKYGGIRIYTELSDDLQWPDLSGMWADLRMGLKYFRDIKKTAMASDRKWIESFDKHVAHLVPGEVKTFGLNERKKALDWLAED